MQYYGTFFSMHAAMQPAMHACFHGGGTGAQKRPHIRKQRRKSATDGAPTPSMSPVLADAAVATTSAFAVPVSSGGVAGAGWISIVPADRTAMKVTKGFFIVTSAFRHDHLNP